MSVANHEGSRIVFSGTNKNGSDHTPEVGRDVIDCAWQTATISVRTNNEPIQAIGYRGVAAISDLIGSVELSLSGIVTYEPNGANYSNKGPKGLLNTDLYSLVSEFGDIVIDTKGEDLNDVGQRCSMLGMFVTSVSMNFQQNATVTSDWNFVGYDCTWGDAIFNHEVDMIIGDGTNFVPLSSKDLDLTVIAPDSSSVGGLQSVNFSATINRTEVYEIGQLAPIDRPVQFPFEVTAQVEALADTASLLRNFSPTYKWNNASSPSTPNKFDIFVDHLDGQRICGGTNMRPTDGGLSVSVGANSTVTMSFTGWNLEM